MREPSNQQVFPDGTGSASQWPIGAMLKLIAHELRSPLTTLRLALQLGQRRLNNGVLVESSTFEKALAQVDQLTSVIAELSDAAILVDGDVNLKMEDIDVARVIQQAIGTMSRDMGGHQIQFARPLFPTCVVGDRRCLNQLALNLLENACKFSQPSEPVQVSMAIVGSEVLISIQDKGIGVPIAEQERIFDMFYRAGNAMTSSAQGLGLGLYIAREIVNRHGGRIWLESEAANGSTFSVAFPFKRIE